MAEKYRKLTAAELDALGIKTSNNKKYSPFIEYAQKYYPNNAYVVLVKYRSEYNDNTYDNSIKYIVVYDTNGEEVTPIKSTASEAREQWDSLPVCPTGKCYLETELPMDDLIIYLKQPVDLYVKESA